MVGTPGSTSGSYTLPFSNAELTLEAFSRCQMRATQLEQMHSADAVRSLNLMLQSWANKGVNWFSLEQNVISLVAGTATYVLPAEVMSVLDVYYNQIISTGPGPDWDTPLYNAAQPIVSNDPQIIITNSQNRWMSPIGETDFARIPNPNWPGPPNQYWINRLGPPYQLTMTIWPVTTLSYPQAAITYFACRQLQTAGLANGETLDAPNRFIDAAAAELAVRLARKYSPKLIGGPGQGGLLDDMTEAWRLAAGEDGPKAPIQIAGNIAVYYSGV